MAGARPGRAARTETGGGCGEAAADDPDLADLVDQLEQNPPDRVCRLIYRTKNQAGDETTRDELFAVKAERPIRCRERRRWQSQLASIFQTTTRPSVRSMRGIRRDIKTGRSTPRSGDHAEMQRLAGRLEPASHSDDATSYACRASSRFS